MRGGEGVRVANTVSYFTFSEAVSTRRVDVWVDALSEGTDRPTTDNFNVLRVVRMFMLADFRATLNTYVCKGKTCKISFERVCTREREDWVFLVNETLVIVSQDE